MYIKNEINKRKPYLLVKLRWAPAKDPPKHLWIAADA